MHYEWDSTSGNLDHLLGCELGEIVTYPNGDPYIAPDPPFDLWVIDNPTVNWGFPASDGEVYDHHTKHSGFSKPYCNEGFTGSQWYRYRDCLWSITNLMGPLSIIRVVSGEGQLWRYSIIKDPGYAEIFPLP